MYCPKCLHEQPYEGPCEQCDEPVLPDDVPNPYFGGGGVNRMTGPIVLVTIITVVGVAYYLRMMGAF